MANFVKILDSDYAYNTHPSAKYYGMLNYHFWLGRPKCNDGDILEIVKEVNVNSVDDSFILKDKEGIEYLLSKEGCSDIFTQ